jgi:hypothetical protein
MSNSDNNRAMYKRDVHRDVNTLHAQMMTLINTLNNVVSIINNNANTLPDNNTTTLLLNIKDEIAMFVGKQHFVPRTEQYNNKYKLPTEVTNKLPTEVIVSKVKSVKPKKTSKFQTQTQEQNQSELTVDEINNMVSK